jgi:excisionase family DNA binding protein
MKVPFMPARKQREPQQTAFIKPVPPPVKNGDILDVDEAAALLKVSKKTVYSRVKENAIPHARLGRKLLFHRQSLIQWIADGGDRVNRVSEGEQLTLDQLTGMLNNS